MKTSAFLAACSLLVAGAKSFNVYSFLGLQQPLKTNKKVAVIGAGAAGSSTAYHLKRFAQDARLDVDVTVFERNEYIGGRSTTVHAYDDPELPVELGASIFVDVNHILIEVCKEFNLSTQGVDDDRPVAGRPELGVWDGVSFVYTQRGTIWDLPRLLWRYGYAPIRTRNLVQSTVKTFLQMYEAPHFPWSSLSEAAWTVGLTKATAATGVEYLEANSIKGRFVHEIIQASTRVNYAQQLDEIHGLEAIVSMAPEGAKAVEGGNWQMFAHMAKAGSSDVRVNVTVSAIERLSSKVRFKITSGPTESSQVVAEGSPEIKPTTEYFDSVVLAAPYQFANLTILPPPAHIPADIPYVRLHVTLFTTPHRISGRAFGLKHSDKVPNTILTTTPADSATHQKPPFFSISTLRSVANPAFSPPRTEYIYKIFTNERVDSAFLRNLFGLPQPADGEEVNQDDITWMYRKVWHSYPYEIPRVTFEEIKLDNGLWYTPGIESFISTMETSALMGKNVARLIVDEWTGREDNQSKEADKVVKEAS